MNHDQKIENFAEREFQKHIDNTIIEDGAGICIVFGAYLIQAVDQGVTVRNRSDDIIGFFSNKKTALGYCTADKFHRLNLALQIKNLDKKKQILANDLYCSRIMAARTQTADMHEMVETKMQPKFAQYQVVCEELEKCVNSAKYLQLKGFQNETARVFYN